MKWKMPHPYEDGVAHTVEVDLKAEVMNDVPHGMCQMRYNYHGNHRMSFEGFGFMNKGVLSGGPAIFFTQDSRVYSYSSMIEGRP